MTALRKLMSRCYRLVPDRIFLQLKFRKYMGQKLNLRNPQTFNEKLQWLKLYDRKPEYTAMVDKYAAKQYVADKIGQEYIIPTLGVWDRFDEIHFDDLPDQFVLKCTHDSGGLVICRNKAELDKEAARAKLENSLKQNYYWIGREWPYRHVKPRIIAEQYMVDESGHELKDYKFFCFGGVCKCLKVDFDRDSVHRANYYDVDGNLLDFGEMVCPPNPKKQLPLPPNTTEMVRLAETLSQNMPFVRVDFYNVRGRIYFGELTFYPASGFGPFTEERWDRAIGNWIALPQKR